MCKNDKLIFISLLFLGLFVHLNFSCCGFNFYSVSIVTLQMSMMLFRWRQIKQFCGLTMGCGASAPRSLPDSDVSDAAVQVYRRRWYLQKVRNIWTLCWVLHSLNYRIRSQRKKWGYHGKLQRGWSAMQDCIKIANFRLIENRVTQVLEKGKAAAAEVRIPCRSFATATERVFDELDERYEKCLLYAQLYVSLFYYYFAFF